MITQKILLNRHAPPIFIKLIQTNDLDLLSSLGRGEGKPAFPVKMTCFVPSQDVKSNIRRAVKENKELSSLPVTIVVQPPLGEYNVLLLLWYISEIPAKKTYNNNCLAVEFKDGNQWLFIAQDMNLKESTFEKSAELSLNTLFKNLEHFGFNYHHLLHTWFFIPQITEYSDQIERYQIFNKFRREILLKQPDPSRPVFFYPASTGIGSHNNCVWASAVAFKSNNPILSHMMDNERQVPAHQYPQKESIEPPLFSRGMCLLFKKTAIIFVSGTASILNAETVHENDIVGQTHQTIRNMHSLLTQNAIEHNLESSPVDVKESIKYITVYIKQDRDYPAVKDICCSYFVDIPIAYVKADICRNNLMVEIECIACMNNNLRRS